MSEANGATAERLKGLEARVAKLEGAAEIRGGELTQILIQLAKLEARVGYLAAGIGTVTGIGTSLVVQLVRGAIGAGP